MAKTKVKNIVIMTILIILVMVSTVKATNNSIASEIDMNNKEEVSNTIRDLILTIGSEGMQKNLLSEAINMYTEATKTYTNEEIAGMIEEHKDELTQNGIKSEDIDSMVKVLNSFDTEKMKKVLETLDADKIAEKIANGESTQDIIKEITASLSTTEKIGLAVDVILSARIMKTILIIIIAIFVYRTLLRCVIYKKAKRQAWAPFVPIYRNIVMLKICNMSPWWLLLLLVPVIGWIILWIVHVASRFMLAEGFGRGPIFAFGLWLLAPIFETVLVFARKIKYIGFEEIEE